MIKRTTLFFAIKIKMIKWNEKIRKLFTLWLIQINKLRIMHCETAQKMNKYNDRMIILLVTLTGLASLGSFINLSDFNTRVKFILNIISGSLALTACVITSINKELKYGELAGKHQIVAAEYHRISNLIQIAFVSEKNVDPSVVIENVTNTIEMMERFSMPFAENGASLSDLPNYVLIENAIKEVEKIHVPDKDNDVIIHLDTIKNNDDISGTSTSAELATHVSDLSELHDN